jgi:trk system potassium uptake protein TrkH
MFIGGAPGSTSGGIKTTTVVVLFFSALTFIRGKSETVLMGRTIAWRLVSLALSIFLLSITMLCLFYGALLITEQDGLLVGSLTSDVLLFELISAFATVGLSTGVLADLTGAGKFIMILCMFIGRIGPLTMALVIGLRDSRQRVRFPEEDISIG